MNIFELLIIQPIFNLLIALYSIIPGGDFGIAIIVFTILVRSALFPLVKRQLHQARAMKKLQPELAKIKSETKGNRQLESQRMMDLYKANGVNPFQSIFVLVIQLPIFIALYQVIRIFTYQPERIESLTYDFLHGLSSINSVIVDPSSFNEKLLGLIDLTKPAVSNGSISLPILLIAIISAIAQYYMGKQLMPTTESSKSFKQIMSEAADGKTANQSEINALISGKMARFFPLIMLFIMISLPGALVLYYAVSNIVAVVQQGYILNHDEADLEELADEAIEVPAKTSKKANKANKKTKENTSNKVTRVVAKDTKRRRV